MKNILKTLGVIFLIIFIITVVYSLVTLSYTLGIKYNELQEQLSQVASASANSTVKSIKTANELGTSINNSKTEIIATVKSEVQSVKTDLDKTKSDIEEQRLTDNLKLYSEINKVETELIIKTADVDKDLIINGSVFVQSMMGSGSGTVIKKTKDSMYIITCYHVIEPNYEAQKKGFKIGVTIGYGKEANSGKTAGVTVYGAEIIKADKENDLALLKTFFNDDDLNEIKLAKTDPIRGEVVYSVGHPLGLMRAVSKGILTSKVEGFYISDNTTTFGNSGGGLFNIKGELIGIPAQVMGYGGGNDANGEVAFIPESGLGMSISLLRIKEFLIGTEAI